MTGLLFNWLSFYLSIVLGFLSIGVGPLIILLLIKLIYRKKELTESHMALITIAYRGTTAAEASTGLLFVIWLTTNSRSFYDLDFNPPSWFLPSTKVLANRVLVTSEWVMPLAVHWFLMLIPGLLGISLGWAISKRFLENEEEYRFPSIIQTKFLIEATTTKHKERQRLFIKLVTFGFVLSILGTVSLPSLDFSSNKIVLGVTLGLVGVALFAVGFIIKMPQITLGALFWGIAFYVVLSSTLLPDDFAAGSGAMTVHDAILSELYLAFLIGLLIGGLFLSTILKGILKEAFKRIRGNNDGQNAPIDSNEGSMNPPPTTAASPIQRSLLESAKKPLSRNELLLTALIRRQYKILILHTMLCLTSVIFVIYFQLLPLPFHLVVILLLWVLIIGNLVNGFIVTQSIAKSSSSASVPFVFDYLPLYIGGARGFLPYLVFPKAEPTETSSLVTSLKLGSLFNLQRKETITTYLAGYLAAIITTPFFALLLWHAFGIGTDQLPAPAFPLFGSLLAAFASGEPLTFFNLSEIGLGAVVGIILGVNISLGAVLGLLFPLPMVIPLAVGGLARFIVDRKVAEDVVEQKWQFSMTALATGASLAVLPLIMFTLIF